MTITELPRQSVHSEGPRKGLHVDVQIFWGAGSPLRAHPALKLAPPDSDGPLAS